MEFIFRGVTNCMTFFIDWFYKLSLKDIYLLFLLFVFMISVLGYLEMGQFVNIIYKKIKSILRLKK